MKNAKDAEPQERTCSLPPEISCDGLSHYWAIWDEELRRSIPVDGSCPLRHHNRAVRSYWRFCDDDGMSRADALAAVRAHGGEL
jgi:hypothetical protein